MLDRITDMRVEAAILAAESRQLRIGHRKARNSTRRLVGKQEVAKAGLSELNRNNIYAARVGVTKEARLLHLARMLLKGRDYDKVEAFTYHQVDASALYDMVWVWEPQVTESYVLQWLGRDAA